MPRDITQLYYDCSAESSDKLAPWIYRRDENGQVNPPRMQYSRYLHQIYERETGDPAERSGEYWVVPFSSYPGGNHDFFSRENRPVHDYSGYELEVITPRYEFTKEQIGRPLPPWETLIRPVPPEYFATRNTQKMMLHHMRDHIFALIRALPETKFHIPTYHLPEVVCSLSPEFLPQANITYYHVLSGKQHEKQPTWFRVQTLADWLWSFAPGKAPQVKVLLNIGDKNDPNDRRTFDIPTEMEAFHTYLSAS